MRDVVPALLMTGSMIWGKLYTCFVIYKVGVPIVSGLSFL